MARKPESTLSTVEMRVRSSYIVIGTMCNPGSRLLRSPTLPANSNHEQRKHVALFTSIALLVRHSQNTPDQIFRTGSSRLSGGWVTVQDVRVLPPIPRALGLAPSWTTGRSLRYEKDAGTEDVPCAATCVFHVNG
eukprot:532827-Amphidinium_carterae.1